ncbi:MAG: hypothetical protein MI867_02910 [Pseudomonadales bacterium]|nr:hypothetical protein [Pseudomonadales bacterium]
MNLNAKSKGQSTVGLLVAGMLFLVPLMIGMVYLAKIIDTKHKLQEAARYAAWERTIYRPTVSPGFQRKSNIDIQREIQQRVFGEPDDLIDSRDDRRLVRTARIELDPMQSTFDYSRRGRSIPLLEEYNNQRDTLVQYRFSERNPGGTAQRAIRQVVNRGLRLPSSTVARSEVAVQIAKIPQIDLGAADFRMDARHVLLAGSWNARSPSEIRRSVRRVVPTSLLSHPVLRQIQNVAGSFFGEVRSSSLDWGRIDTERVPGQRMRRYR